MSKLLPFLVAAAGASTVSVGGVYMLKQPSKGTGDNNSKKEDKKLLFENVEAFNKVSSSGGKKCLEGYFDDLNISESHSSAQDITASQPDTNTFFKTASTDGNTHKSCLLINWKKESYTKDSNEQWKGKFVWLWTFVRGDEGFISFNVAENKENEQKLKFSGVFYLVGKKSDKTGWEIKFKKNIENNKEASKSDLDNYFPKPHTSLTSAQQSYWGFMSQNADMDKICQNSECGEAKHQDTAVQEFIWTATNGTENKLQDWSTNFNWWTNLYGTSPWSLSTKIANFKGTWNKPQ